MRRSRVISLLVLLVLVATLAGPAGTSAQSDMELARESGLASIQRLVSVHPEWEGADLVRGQVYHDLAGRVIAYLFEINKAGEAVGYIIVGGSAYGYDTLEASTALPPAVPRAEEVSETLGRDLGVRARKDSVENPHLVYLGYGQYVAMYQTDDRRAAFDLRSKRAMWSSDLRPHLATPEEYETQDGEASIASAYYYWLAVPLLRMDDPDLPDEYENNNNCAPTSGAMIVEFYRQRGYPNFSAWHLNHDRLYLTMGTNTGLVPGTDPWRIGPGWVQYAHEKGYTFGTTYYGPSDSDFILVQNYMDAGRPVIVMFWYDTPYIDWHACVIRGYGFDDGARMISINDPQGSQADLNWAVHLPYITIHWLWPE